jgi:uncharacterized protein
MANIMLPKQIDPIQLADNQNTLKGDLQLSDMERLKDIFVEEPGIASIELFFNRDAQGYAYLKGSIATGFKVICQRCNLPMILQLNISVEMSPVRTDEEAERLPERYDPLLLSSDTISLLGIVEEEILLSIPIVPKHPMKDCKVKSSKFIEWEEEREEVNPFKVLKKLLRE